MVIKLMPRKAFPLKVLVLALVSTAVLFSRDAKNVPQGLTLATAREMLAGPRMPKELGSISLRAFDFWRELEIGKGIEVLAISCDRGGGLAAFRPDGSNIGTVPTGKIIWLQLFDLNEDGVSEVITEEVEGEGTGILMKAFSVYMITPKAIKKVWKGESYLAETIASSSKVLALKVAKQGFVRFDESGGGRKARMTYVLTSPTSPRIEVTVFEMNGEVISKR